MHVRVVIAAAVVMVTAAGAHLLSREETEPEPEPEPVAVRPALSGGSDDADLSDPVLVRARRELVQGGLTEATRAELTASDDPAHARARRVLLAMDAAPPDPEPSPPPSIDSSAALVVPTVPAAVDTGATPGATNAAASSPKPSGTSPPPVPAAREAAPRPTLRKVGLRGSSSGATLTLDAGSGVVVGVANQRSSGIVRLVVEASADSGVLTSRPRVEGARVASVKRVGRSVFVTVELDPGWELDRIQKTGRGAKVLLKRP